MNGKKILAVVAAAAGLACALVGLFVLTDPALKSLSGLCTGIGAAAFGLGLGSLVRLLAVPEAELKRQADQKHIEVRDERNTRIREKEGAMSNKALFYALCAAVLVFGMLGDLRAVLILTGVLLLEFVCVIALTAHYSKRI